MEDIINYVKEWNLKTSKTGLSKKQILSLQ